MTKSQKLYITLVKRPLGFFGALMAIIVTSPVWVVTMIVLFFANKNGFKGIFFTQERPGKDERIFKVIKFKTMTDECDSEGKLLSDADRLTKIGKFIRSTSVDELPQLLNILKGDMAFIGPRPLLVRYLPWYTAEECHRHDVLPGISGWAQSHGRNRITWDEKLALDIWYVNNVSLKTDMCVIIRTIKSVVLRESVEVAGVEALDVYRMKEN